MACFIVPGCEAIAATIVQKAIGKERAEKIKLKWLNLMLYGGVIMLLIDHIWSGEVVPWLPFLTAMANPAEVGTALHEMATLGTTMAIVITLVWVVMVAVATVLSKRAVLKKPALV